MFAAQRRALVALLVLTSNAACRSEPTAPPAAATQPAKSAVAPSAVAPSAVAPNAAAPSATAAPTATAEPEGGLAPNPGCTKRKNTGVMSACEAHKDNLGAFAPTPRETADVMKLASGVCYCAKDLDVPALACASRVKSGTVKVTIGNQGDPTDCTVGISSVSWKGRRWVVVNAFNRDVSTFYSILEIYEQKKGSFVKYYGGFNGLPDAEALQKGAEGVTPEMKRDWPTLPAEVRKAFEGKGP